MPAAPVISIVSPVYLGELLLDELVARISLSLSSVTDAFEIILVDDGSKDDTWENIKALAAVHPFLTGIHFYKNVGQHPAIHAGISYAKGDFIVVLDCDLQDRPEEIPELYKRVQDGFDAVFAIRNIRNDPWLKGLYSSVFYSVLHFITGVSFAGNVANFGIYSRAVIQQCIQSDRAIFFLPLAVRRNAKHVANYTVLHDIRAAGKTTYSITKAIQLAVTVLIGNSWFAFLIRKKKYTYLIDQIIISRHDTI